jgi:hypothetical protein
MGSLAQASGRRYQVVNETPDDQGAWLSSLSLVVQNIIAGKLNNNGTVTLTANAATTTLTDSRIGANSTICLMPTTANAAGAIATTYFDTFATGSCVIRHTNNAQVDKTFNFTITG